MDRVVLLRCLAMQISTYKPGSVPNELTQLLREKYGNCKNFNFFLSDSKKAFEFCMDNDNVSFYPIEGRKDGHMKAHIALIIDKRLPRGEAFFGFMESPDDVSAFSLLWNNLIKEAKEKGISVIKGPVNGSIWHQYRCIKETDGSPSFKAEVLSEPYYYDFLMSQKPSIEVGYFSASREPYDIVLKMINQGSYEKLESHGFSMRVAKQVTPSELKTISDISKAVFKENWGYTELNDKEFTELYSTEKLNEHLDALYLLYRGEIIIGFCSTSKENELTLLLKTICVLPAYRGLGLGNALAYKIHLDAKKEGIKKIIYALIREGNSVNNFPKEEAVIFRRYAAFEFHI